ncbi:hypothetical protein [Exiguobacterium sp. AT1b]|uniref:Uncharacterized protein n=1 Tax=Exiguobacterium sp. (strain ATCC BAA-1283 / AT1b) TaxID=360911 RepID=C4L6X3_EXISA|nr:hypothetical protein [Exiguobacterium sp. AT1b]ACQ70066.1 hypothetical protein EAT1b_1138 [Exiguobacterium sp. AT1b]
MNEWEKWIPVKSIPERLHKESLMDDGDSLRIIVSDATEGQKYSFLFDGLLLSYRNSDEGSRLRMLEHLDRYYAHLEYGNWTLFKMKNSSYLEWFAQESLERYEGMGEVEHYVFLTSNDVIEVLSADPPTVTKMV